MKNKVKNSLVDLHMHSTASDGQLAPADLAKLVASAGLEAFALTDHDTLDGLEEASGAAARLKIEFVPGVELSARFKEREVHLLGYYPKKRAVLEEHLALFKKERFKRMAQMVEKLKGEGFKIDEEEVLKEAGPAAPGRLHLARLLAKKGYVLNPGQAFALYLGRGRAGYVPRKLPLAEEALSLLLKTGAVPVLAHPGEEGRGDLLALKAQGLKGVEVFHPIHTKKLISYYLKQAEGLDLLVTGGSDFHAISEREGRGFARHATNYHYLERLKEAAEL